MHPPLGPGAPAVDRLVAFFRASVDLLDRQLHLVLGAETGRARFRGEIYAFRRRHVEDLLAGAAPAAVVDALLAPLAPEVYEYQRDVRGLTSAEIADGLTWLARRVSDQVTDR
ncbi:hypothetical protein GCM10022243_33010 [Saccharothrix violaceirubra]|uniref:TetR family transcriptional regulator n=1 Tax=Saccharothrix violaceirubra TaxID=413306 RepID=A0A7W7T166_9PSEU|nr:hypothetical protein [Saccharothrix violaceirubra]MBB4964152.1 hypothetical protein [Saccharothrix violaceirubra]